MNAAADRGNLRNDLIASIPSLRAFANSLCGQPALADDLVQETLVKAWTNLGSFTVGTNLKAWLFTILRNVYFSELRKRRREVEDGDGAFAARLSVHGEQLGHMHYEDLVDALNKLAPDQREAVILVGASGFSYEEAAEIAGCAIGTMKSRVNRARRRLSDLLGLEADDEFGPDARSRVLAAVEPPAGVS
jgi:RNA polymerase sigma-70 factor (ECF subfamily)